MTGRQITVLAAIAKNRVIGRNGRIPWDLPQDRAHFRELTMGNVIVMGRRTFDEIGHPLFGRSTYLLSSTKRIEEENCHTASSLAEVLRREPGRDIFICGGAFLYQEALPLADRLCLTELSWEVEGDIFFPEFDRREFRVTERREVETAYSGPGDKNNSGNIAFLTYERIL